MTNAAKTSLSRKIRVYLNLSFFRARYAWMVLLVHSAYRASQVSAYLGNIAHCQRHGRAVEAYKRGLENILAEIRRHDDHLDDVANDGDNAIPPNGDDYNEIVVKLTVLAESSLKEATDRGVKRFRIIHK